MSRNRAMQLTSYERAEALERYLAPHDEREFSFPAILADDEQERFPHEACNVLQRWGLHQYFVPQSCGGRLANCEEALALLRSASRRDLSVAIALGKTYLGAIHVWIAGSDEQVRDLAAIVMRGDPVSFALTERAHGGDVTQTDVTAEKVDGGYVLTGEKWLINNGTRSAALTVLARSEAVHGPRACSLFLVRKDLLDRYQYEHLPKIKTLGIRGADISGVRFERAFVPEQALIGVRGNGLDIAIRGLQVTRLFCAGFSLGAADTALRLATSFARTRALFGKTVWDIDSARATIVDAFADLLLADGAAIVAHRAIHLATEQLSVVSAIIKYLVPTLVEDAIRSLGVVIGARHYLREEYQAGIFQKVLRDSAVVSLFDGSTAVNLSSIAVQLRALRQGRLRLTPAAKQDLAAQSVPLYELDGPLPEFAPRQLQLLNFGRETCVQVLDTTSEQLVANTPRGAVVDCTTSLLTMLIAERDACEDAVDAIHTRLGPASATSPEMFELARRYSLIYAAAACVNLWVHNRDTMHPALSRGEWLAYVLHRTLVRFRSTLALQERPFASAVAEGMLSLDHEGRLFSVAPFKLAGRFGGDRSEST